MKAVIFAVFASLCVLCVVGAVYCGAFCAVPAVICGELALDVLRD